MGAVRGVVVTPFRVLRDGVVEFCEDSGKVVFVGEFSEWRGSASDLLDLGVEGPVYVLPGFIDVHVHGGYGVDALFSGASELVELSRKLVRHGVVGFVPTTVTYSHEGLVKALRNIVEASKMCGGARILGIYMEGPYISVKKRGAQNPEFIREPSTREFDEYVEVSEGLLKFIAVAPEVRGCLDFIRYAVSKGVTVAVGHTDADYATTKAAIDAGARQATHTFNAMKGFHHREPGTVGAVLEDPRVTCEVIADLIHVHPAAIRLLFKVKGAERVALITDAIAATGLPDGEYNLGGLKVIVKGGICRLPDGTLAGSTLTMDRAFKNVVEVVGVPITDAAVAASYTPAKALGIEHRKGSIAPGKDADIVVLDAKFEVVATVVGGKVVYLRK